MEILAKDELIYFAIFDYRKRSKHFHDCSFFIFYLNRAVTPPSSAIIMPVIHDDESSAKNQTALTLWS